MSKLKRMYVFDNGVQYNDKSTMLAGYNVATFRDQKKVSTYIIVIWQINGKYLQPRMNASLH